MLSAGTTGVGERDKRHNLGQEFHFGSEPHVACCRTVAGAPVGRHGMAACHAFQKQAHIIPQTGPHRGIQEQLL